jgi:hypothetical protein
LADEEPEATPEAAPEAPQQANEPPANTFGARQRTALEELATALGLDDEPVAPPQNDPACGHMAPELAPEPIKIWTAPPEVVNNEPDPEPDELPLERPEEVPEPAPEEEESPFPKAGEVPLAAPVPPPAPAGHATAETDPEILREILMWERALKNKNPIIRKQAARQLLKLTGKEYDYS